MGRYPRQARDAQVKCIDCNAPVVVTVDGRYVCVGCGESPVAMRNDGPGRTASTKLGAPLQPEGNQSANGD